MSTSPRKQQRRLIPVLTCLATIRRSAVQQQCRAQHPLCIHVSVSSPILSGTASVDVLGSSAVPPARDDSAKFAGSARNAPCSSSTVVVAVPMSNQQQRRLIQIQRAPTVSKVRAQRLRPLDTHRYAQRTFPPQPPTALGQKPCRTCSGLWQSVPEEMTSVPPPPAHTPANSCLKYGMPTMLNRCGGDMEQLVPDQSQPAAYARLPVYAGRLAGSQLPAATALATSGTGRPRPPC